MKTLRCINDGLGSLSSYLTIGRVYTDCTNPDDVLTGYVTVIDDAGDPHDFLATRFEKVEA